MRTTPFVTSLVFACVLVGSAGRGGAQDASLAAALAMRRPPTELVAQVCPDDATFYDDHICARGADGSVPAFRRVGMRGYVFATRRADDLYFVVDDGSTQTRFADHLWRWDLARDAIHGLGEIGRLDDEHVIFLGGMTFGVLYRTTAGFVLHDGTTARPVAVPEGMEDAVVVVHDGRTYATWQIGRTVEVRALALHGDRITWERVASLPGGRGISRGGVITSIESRGATRVVFHMLSLPGTTVVDAVAPRSTRGSRLTDDGATLLTWSARSGVSIAVATGVLTQLDPAAIPRETIVIRPRAVAWMRGGESEVWLQAGASRGVLLGASGITVRRRAPREQTACRCRGEDMACGASGPTIVGACGGRRALAEIQEDDPDRDPEDFESARATPSFTGDGRFRIDRVEPDLARITRLADGAHLWARLFGDFTLLAQRDDGTYFLADRSLEPHFVVRQGTSLLTSPTAPLTTRADLYRATLVADFFAGR